MRSGPQTKIFHARQPKTFPPAQPIPASSANPAPPLLLYFHAALPPRNSTLGPRLPRRRHLLPRRLRSLPPPRLPRYQRLPLPRLRQSDDPRSRPSLLLLGRQHPHAPRRHAWRTPRPAPLRDLFSLPRSNPWLRLLRFLVLRKFPLHWHLHEGRPRQRPPARQLRDRRLDPPLRPMEPSSLRSKNRPVHPRSRLAWHARHPRLPR